MAKSQPISPGRVIRTYLIITSLYTLAYVAAARSGWGIWPFVAASFMLGLGFTFYTGAVEAWLVDALEHSGYTGHTEWIFARGQMVFSASMLAGTV